jgi:hypothetical protein
MSNRIRDALIGFGLAGALAGCNGDDIEARVQDVNIGVDASPNKTLVQPDSLENPVLSTPVPEAQRLRDLRNQGMTLYNEGNSMLAKGQSGWGEKMDAAKDVAYEMLEINPNAVTANYLIGLVDYASAKFLKDDNPHKADYFLEGAIHLERARMEGITEPDLYLVLGDIHRFMGYNYSGIGVLTDGHRRHPNNSFIQARLGRHQMVLADELENGFVPKDEDFDAYLANNLPDLTPGELREQGRDNILDALERSPKLKYVRDVAEMYGIGGK